jgi:hypothetical protein
MFGKQITGVVRRHQVFDQSEPALLSRTSANLSRAMALLSRIGREMSYQPRIL